MTEEVKREVVRVGLDFRPIPVDVGDGKVWEFHPDPAPSAFQALVVSARGVASTSQSVGEGDLDGFTGSLTELQKAIGGLLVHPAQRTAWSKTTYGLTTLVKLSNLLAEQFTGFTQESAGSSGGH